MGLVSNCFDFCKKEPQDDQHQKYDEDTWEYKNDPEFWKQDTQALKLSLFLHNSFLYHWLSFLSKNNITDTSSHKFLYKGSMISIKATTINTNHGMILWQITSIFLIFIPGKISPTDFKQIYLLWSRLWMNMIFVSI